jgi:hypothetical protein
MTRKAPVKPRKAPLAASGSEQAPTPPSDAERLSEALKANETLVALLNEVCGRLDGLRLAILRSVG